MLKIVLRVEALLLGVVVLLHKLILSHFRVWLSELAELLEVLELQIALH